MASSSSRTEQYELSLWCRAGLHDAKAISLLDMMNLTKKTRPFNTVVAGAIQQSDNMLKAEQPTQRCCKRIHDTRALGCRSLPNAINLSATKTCFASVERRVISKELCVHELQHTRDENKLWSSNVCGTHYILPQDLCMLGSPHSFACSLPFSPRTNGYHARALSFVIP